jgi:hypothetical protein
MVLFSNFRCVLWFGENSREVHWSFSMTGGIRRMAYRSMPITPCLSLVVAKHGHAARRPVVKICKPKKPR